MTQTARIYGGSLYDLAKEEGLTQAILEQAGEVEMLFSQNPSYRTLLAEPSLPKKERCGLLDQAFAESLHPYLLNFLKILCEENLLAEYSGCVEAYQERYDSDHGIARAKVYSAVALTESQKQALRDRLQKQSGKQVILTEKLQPSVLGGLRVEMEGLQYDGTVAGRLRRLHRDLKETQEE